MPWLLTVRVKRPSGRFIRIWVPVLVFLPLVLLAVLVAAVACLVYRVSVARALGAGWCVLSALPGTRIDIEYGRTAVFVTIR